VLFCSFLSCTVGGVQLWSLAEATYCKYDHFDIPFTVWWLTWLHADSYTITHLIFWTQYISPFMHGSTILSPGSKCCCVHLALMLSCIFDFVAHWMGENAWVDRPSISCGNYYFPHGQTDQIWSNGQHTEMQHIAGVNFVLFPHGRVPYQSWSFRGEIISSKFHSSALANLSKKSHT